MMQTTTRPTNFEYKVSLNSIRKLKNESAYDAECITNKTNF